MAAFSTFLRFLKWKMDGKWEMENRVIVTLPRSIVDSVAGKGDTPVHWASGKG